MRVQCRTSKPEPRSRILFCDANSVNAAPIAQQLCTGILIDQAAAAEGRAVYRRRVS